MYDLVVSGHRDPLLNLAFESCLFDSYKEGDRPLLYLWVNDSSVFMGRFQNPWQECRIPLLKQLAVPLFRRNSGGGCVYHDPGNLNFTFMTSRSDYSKTGQLDFLISFLASLDQPVHAVRNKRNDLVIPGLGGRADRKFSGSAYREKKGKAYHHGTLLIDTDLEKLLAFLRPADSSIVTKATDSVRSRVVNLKELSSDLSVTSCMEALKEYCTSVSETPVDFRQYNRSDMTAFPGMESAAGRLGSDEWVYCKTPSFSFSFTLPDHPDFSSVSVQVKNGCATAVDLLERRKGGVVTVSLPEPVLLSDFSAAETLEMYFSGLKLHLKEYI